MATGAVFLVMMAICAVLAADLSPSASIELRKAAGFKEKEWYEHATIYQIYPRSFQDSNGDGIGDLNGITSRLDHLHDIGVNAIWMSPMFESPQKDFGYDVSDFYAVHHEYGTMADFEAFMKKAIQLGISVLLDFVPNHSSDEHEWFKKSVKRVPGYEDYYVWLNGTTDSNGRLTPPNNWVSVFGGSAWQWNDERQQFYLHQFLAGQPDLNYRNQKVVNEMKKVLKFWLSKGIGGFRVDAINHMFEDKRFLDEPRNEHNNDPNSFDYLNHIYVKDQQETYDMIYDWRKMLDEYRDEHKLPSKILMTEAYASLPDTMRFYQSATGVQGAHMPFNFGLIYVNRHATAQSLKEDISRWLDNMPTQKHTPNWVTGSHDHSRVASRNGPEFIAIMNTINLMLPGTSCTYYGEEIGMTDHKGFPISDNRDPNRTPMQWNLSMSAGFSTSSKTWLPVNPNYKTINLEALKNSSRSHYHHYKELTKLRQEFTIINGDYNAKSLNKELFVFLREYAGHPTYVVVINLGSEQQVDLSAFGNLHGKKLTVAASAAESKFRIGNDVDNVFLVASHDAIVLRTSSASTVARTSILMLVAIFILGKLI